MVTASGDGPFKSALREGEREGERERGGAGERGGLWQREWTWEAVREHSAAVLQGG